MTTNYDPLNGDGAENYPYVRPQDFNARRSAGAALMIFLAGSAVGVLILAWLFS
jgi:hypothetical protein